MPLQRAFYLLSNGNANSCLPEICYFRLYGLHILDFAYSGSEFQQQSSNFYSAEMFVFVQECVLIHVEQVATIPLCHHNKM